MTRFHHRSAAVLAVSIVTAVTAVLSGCDLDSAADDYPDDYEEAIIELLDGSDVVSGHGAEVDGWARAASVPHQDAPVQLTESVTRDQWHELLVQLADLAEEHNQIVPGLAYQVEEFANLTLTGYYGAEEAAQLLDVTTSTGWRQVTAFVEEDGATIHLVGSVQDRAEGTELVSQELPSFVADHLGNLRVSLPEDQALDQVGGKDGPIHPESFALAFALGELPIELPSAQDDLTYQLTTEYHGVEPIVLLQTDVRSEELRAAEPDDRPGLAAELGYQEICGQIQSLLFEHVTAIDRVARCTATHVDIG